MEKKKIVVGALNLLLFLVIGLFKVDQCSAAMKLFQEEMNSVRGGTIVCGATCTAVLACPTAQSGCLSGGACGIGSYHTEGQRRSGYPVPHVGDGYWVTAQWDCIVYTPCSDSECLYGYAIYCTDINNGCNPDQET